MKRVSQIVLEQRYGFRTRLALGSKTTTVNVNNGTIAMILIEAMPPNPELCGRPRTRPDVLPGDRADGTKDNIPDSRRRATLRREPI